MLPKNGVILFQGDSITDCRRNYQDLAANSSLGNGYVHNVASNLLATHPALELKVFNRGISGNRIVDLYARWRSDAINLTPDVISVLIGVNDTWHHFGSNNGVEVPRFAKVYDMLLEYTRDQLPQARLVLCEPFVLPCGVVRESWMIEMRERSSVVAGLAEKYDAIFVPFQSLFDGLLANAPAEYWLHDGVHPTYAGHFAMAKFWLEKCGDLV